MTNRPFDLRSRGFTEREITYFVREDSTSPARHWLAWVLAGAALVLFIHLLVLPLIPLETPAAHAEVPLKTNADYCREWQAGVWNVVGATEAEITKLCAEYL